MLSILCNTNLNDLNDPFRQVKSYECLADDEHTKLVLENADLFDGLIAEFMSNNANQQRRIDDFKKYLNDQIIISSTDESSRQQRLDCVALAISCLQLFARANWLGPVPVDQLNLPAVIQQQYKTPESDNRVMSLVKFFPLQSKVYSSFNPN